MTSENDKQNQLIAGGDSKDVTYEDAISFVEFHLQQVEKKFPSKNSAEFDEELKKLTGIGWKRYRQIKGQKEKNIPIRDNSPLRQKVLEWKNIYPSLSQPQTKKFKINKIYLPFSLTFIFIISVTLIVCTAIYIGSLPAKVEKEKERPTTPIISEKIIPQDKPVFPIEEIKIKIPSNGITFSFGKLDLNTKNLECKNSGEEISCNNASQFQEDYFQFIVQKQGGEVVQFEIIGINAFEEIRPQYAIYASQMPRSKGFYSDNLNGETRMLTSNLIIAWGTIKKTFPLKAINIPEIGRQIRQRKNVEFSLPYIKFIRK